MVQESFTLHLLLVLMMTGPGLALFYGGLVRKKNVLSILMQCIFLMGLMTVIWATYGYSLAFGGDNPYFGNGEYLFMEGVQRYWDDAAGGVVTPLFADWLPAGAGAERALDGVVQDYGVFDLPRVLDTAARQVALGFLATIQQAVGSLDAVEGWLKLLQDAAANGWGTRVN